MIIVALDDEEAARKMLERVIRKAEPTGSVFVFETGEEVIRFAESCTVDVAFLDVEMPRLNGIEVAKKLKRINPYVNVVFTTGSSNYALQAMKIHSSGYIMKPATVDDIRAELLNLRNPVTKSVSKKHIVAKTFGSFDLYVDGQPVLFPKERAKELLAYLIDRRGSTVTRKEIAAVIFEDQEYTRSTQAYLSQIVTSLKKTLNEVNAQCVLTQKMNSYSVDTSALDCDAYDYLDGRPDAINQFRGEYMNQYSWAEEQLSRFYK